MVISRFSEREDDLEAMLNGDEFRFGLGLEPVIDHFSVLQQISMDGADIRNEIENSIENTDILEIKFFELK